MSEEKPGRGKNKCERCNSRAAVYQMFDLNLCRRCFREIASKMGFDKHE